MKVKLFGRRKKLNRLSNHINFAGMYVLGLILCLFAVVLAAVRANVRYSVRAEQLSLLPRTELLRMKTESISDQYNSVQKKEKEGKEYTLFIYEEEDPLSLKAKELMEPVLSQMKEPYDSVSVDELTPNMIYGCSKAIVGISHYELLGDSHAAFKSWVKDGGNLMILYAPDKTGSFESLYDIMGIKASGNNTFVEGIHFTGDYMIGGTSRDYFIDDVYESSREVALKDDCKVYLVSTGENRLPLIWRHEYGKGSVVFDNFGIMEKAYRGIHCAAYSMMGDYCVYPVINGATFFIDDFPSPVPEGDAEYITRDYNMSIADFYSQVWWNDVYDMAYKHGIHYTGVIIENYNNQVKGTFKRTQDTARFLLYGNMLLRSGGEIGIHGYNHMPLVLENFDYQDMYDGYIQWPSSSNMKYSITEVFNFTKDLFPDEELKVYVPPSNVLSAEGREVLGTTSIRSIASVYLPADLAYAQEFDISGDDGIINTPRIISGYMIDDYMSFAAMSELNFHLVSTHFQHPDDVLDEDRGAALGWEKLKSGLNDYMDWLYGVAPDIRNLTGSELAAAVQRYDLVKVRRDYNGNRLRLTLDNFENESWMILRINTDRKIDSTQGGEICSLANGVYLVRCDDENVDIYFK